MSTPIRRFLVAVVGLAMMTAGALVVTQRAGAAASTPVVYVATGENFPDALGAGPAAAIVKGPILLVQRDAIPGETAAELSRLSPDRIIIVGGTAVVSASVESGLAAYAPTVQRIAGANRYDTAARLSAATFPATFDADTLQGRDASAFLPAGGTAADSHRLQGLAAWNLVPNGTPPLGTTERGNYAVGNDSTFAWDSIEWGFEMMDRPVSNVVRAGSPSTKECPGTAANPLAAQGHLCIYEYTSSNVSGLDVFGAGDPYLTYADTFGATIYATSAGPGDHWSYGSWAVTVGIATATAPVGEARSIP